jgi:hypothetical protein
VSEQAATLARVSVAGHAITGVAGGQMGPALPSADTDDAPHANVPPVQTHVTGASKAPHGAMYLHFSDETLHAAPEAAA